LVEFVLVLPLMIVVVVQIYTMIYWSKDNIDAQAASWFAVRSQTYDFINGRNTPEAVLKSWLGQAVFTDNQDFEVHLPPPDQSPIDPSNPRDWFTNLSNLGLFMYDVISAPSLDVSMMRTGTVDVYTRDYFEQLPSVLNLAKNVTVEKDGHRCFHSSATSEVYVSWTSFVQNAPFDSERARKNKDNKNPKQEMLDEATTLDQKAEGYYQQYEKETDKDKKKEYYQEYIDAKNEAAKLRQAAAQLPWPSPTPGDVAP
jgi:hypothetical protein